MSFSVNVFYFSNIVLFLSLFTWGTLHSTVICLPFFLPWFLFRIWRCVFMMGWQSNSLSAIISLFILSLSVILPRYFDDDFSVISGSYVYMSFPEFCLWFHFVLHFSHVVVMYFTFLIFTTTTFVWPCLVVWEVSLIHLCSMISNFEYHTSL